MTRTLCLIALAWLAVSGTARADEPRSRFVPLHIVVDTGSRDLAAYQIELRVVHGTAEIVGVEGGAHPAFAKPPYYDPRALRQGHIILAAFSTAPELPAGVGRLLTVHVRETGATPSYAIALMVAADPQGQPINARFEIKRQEVGP